MPPAFQSESAPASYIMGDDEKKLADEAVAAAVSGYSAVAASTSPVPAIDKSPSTASSIHPMSHYQGSPALANGAPPRPTSPTGAGHARECDFDKDPTALYLALQKREWAKAIQRSHEMAKEAQTWVSRKEKDGKLRWRLLPLHAAIIFKAPESVIEALLGAYPKGAECKDDQGMLPLHLAFRNGSTEGIVNLLLVAYPQSIDVKDRKGRIPLVLAQASTSPNRDAFMRALERGPTYYAVAAAATERAAVTAELRAIFDAKLIEVKNHHAFEMDNLRKSSETTRMDLEDRVQELESELAKTQETSQVLVDHVNSLEAQLSSRSDTERFLATKIASLDTSLREVTKGKEEVEASLNQENSDLQDHVKSLENKLTSIENDESTANNQLQNAVNRMEVMSLELSKLENYSSSTISRLEMDLANSKANSAVLEAQLKKKIETEHALASQVSTLASRLAESAAESSNANATYSSKIAHLEKERESLRLTISQLTQKLKKVALSLDSISHEQDKIVEAAALHEESMAKASNAHAKIVADATRQEELLEKADAERNLLLEILERQGQYLDQCQTERMALRRAISVQEDAMGATGKERDALLEGVRKQKDTVRALVKFDLGILPKKDTTNPNPSGSKNGDKTQEDLLVDEIIKNVHQETRERAKYAAMSSPNRKKDDDDDDDDDDDEDDKQVKGALGLVATATALASNRVSTSSMTISKSGAPMISSNATTPTSSNSLRTQLQPPAHKIGDLKLKTLSPSTSAPPPLSTKSATSPSPLSSSGGQIKTATNFSLSSTLGRTTPTTGSQKERSVIDSVPTTPTTATTMSPRPASPAEPSTPMSAPLSSKTSLRIAPVPVDSEEDDDVNAPTNAGSDKVGLSGNLSPRSFEQTKFSFYQPATSESGASAELAAALGSASSEVHSAPRDEQEGSLKQSHTDPAMTSPSITMSASAPAPVEP